MNGHHGKCHLVETKHIFGLRRVLRCVDERWTLALRYCCDTSKDGLMTMKTESWRLSSCVWRQSLVGTGSIIACTGIRAGIMLLYQRVEGSELAWPLQFQN